MRNKIAKSFCQVSQALLLGALMLSVFACGPSQTSASKDQQQADQLFQDRLNQIKPIFGTYIGKVTKHPSNQVVDARLYIGQNVPSVSNPGRVEQTPIPTAQGSLAICDGDSCVTNGVFDDSSAILIQFNGASYNGKVINLSAGGVGNCQNGTCSGAGAIYGSQFSFNGTYDNGVISGIVTESQGDFSLTVTRQ